MKRVDTEDIVSLFETINGENGGAFDEIIATISKDNKRIFVTHQNEGGSHKIVYSIGIDEIDKAISEHKDIENILTTYFSQAAIDYAQQSGELTTEHYKIRLSTATKKFGNLHKELVTKMYNEFKKYVSYNESADAENSSQQIEENVTGIKKWEDLSEDEQYRRLSIDYKTMNVDDSLQEKLSAAYPNIKDGIKILVGQGKGGDTFVNRKESAVWKNARQDMAQLLKNESLVTAGEVFNFAAKSLFRNWELLKIHIPNKPSQKSLSLQEQAKEIISQLNSKNISPQEGYNKILKLLYNKTADAEQSTQQAENVEDVQSKDTSSETSQPFEESVNAEQSPSQVENVEEQNSFEIGTFTHTKTGEKIPSVKLKDRIERDEYLKLNTLAKQNGGSYSTFAKQFLFKTAEGRDAFVEKALNNTSYYGLSSAKNSMTGNDSTKITNINTNETEREETKTADVSLDKIDKIVVMKKSASGSTLYYTIDRLMGTGFKTSKNSAEDALSAGTAISAENVSADVMLKIAIKQMFDRWETRKGFGFGNPPQKGSTAYNTKEKIEKIIEQLNNGEISARKAYDTTKKNLGEKDDYYLEKINKFILDATGKITEIPPATQQEEETADEEESAVDEEKEVYHKFQIAEKDIPNTAGDLDTIKITVKKSKNGANLYYGESGKKMTATEAFWIDQVDKPKKVSQLLKNFKDSSNSTNDFNDSNNKYQVDIHYRVGAILETKSKPFKTLENAVACARYLYNNRGNVRIDEIYVCPKGSQGNKIFKIDKDGTVSYRDDVSDIVKNEFEKSVQQFDSSQVTDDKNHNTITIFSQTGNGSTAIINLVDDRNLIEPHKLLQKFGKSIGVDVKFFNNYNKDFHGAYENGTVYLNVNSARSLTSIFAHELFHFLKANNAKLFNEMAKAAGITQEQLTNYLAETKREDVKENADVTEEMIADAMQEILNRVARKDKSLVERFFAWLKDTLQKFKDFFQNPKGKLTRGQYAKLADTFGKMAVKLKDAEGKKIFRYNTRTHNLELANGESLDGLLEDNEFENDDSSEEQGFFNLGSLSLGGKKYSMSSVDANTTTSDATEFSEYITQQNIEKGRAAVNRVIRTHEDVNGAMHRNEIGDIDFIWGEEGSISRNYSNGYGISKILIKHGQTAVDMIPEVIARGTITRRTNNKVIIEHAGYLSAIKLTWNNESRTWLIANYDTTQEAPNFAEVSLRPANTTTRPSSDRVSASLENSLPQARQRNNSENTATLHNARFSIRGSGNSNTNASNNNSNESTIGKWFSDVKDKFARALGLTGDRIVTAEMAAERLRNDRENAMDDFIKNPTLENAKRLKDLKVSKAMLAAYRKGEEYVTELNIADVTRKSPSRIAEKVAAFRPYFSMGDKAMDKLVKLRDRFAVGLKAAIDFLKTKDDNETLTNLLIDGDANETEYGVLTEQEKNSIIAGTSSENVTKKLQQARIQKICEETGVNENVAKAYVKIRQLMTQAYNMLNETKRRPQTISAYRTDKTIDELKNNKFVKIIKISDTTDDKGNRLVTYKKYAHTKKSYDVTESVLNRFKKDSAMQVLSATVKGVKNGEKVYHVEVLEGIAELTNKAGYIPHLFQQYMIRVKDKDGKIVERFGYGGVIGSGITQREAIKIAEEWQKKNPNSLKDGEEIYIAPKIANFSELGMDEKKYAPIMGDKDFDAMVKNIAKYSDMTIKDAKTLVDGSVKLKNRHRFFGNFMQRKGAKGYSQDMQWVLRHYLNSTARYVALETEFKPQAISLFERQFGSFEKDWENNSLAKFTKQYINDINGNPTTFETMLNKVLNSSSIYRNVFVPKFGERAALTLTNDITRRVGYLKLGMLNLSSALLNLSQLVNAAGYLGGGGRLLKHFGSVIKRGGKLTYKELRILNESGVLSDIGLDTSSGYDKNRNYSSSSILGMVDMIGDKSMYLFQTMDKLCRISSALAAYEQAIEKGKTRSEALEFAKEVNRKSNFSYGVEDAPNMFRRSGVIGKIVLQFYKYPIKQLEIIGDMLPFNKKTTMQQKIAFWFPYLLMCGLMGLPFLDWIDDLLGKVGLFPKDFLQKTAIKGSQAIFGDNEVGRMAGKIAMYGASAAFNIDMSKRTGLSAVMPTDFTNAMLGATGSTIFGTGKNLIDGVVNGTEGAYLNALRSISPGAYNIFAAIEGESLGTRGRKTSVYESVYDRMIRGAGFKSVDESLATDIQRITYNERDSLTKEKQRAVDAFIKEPTTENAKRLKELGVRPDTVKKERERKELDRLGRVQAGMTKAEQDKNQYLLNFSR